MESFKFITPARVRVFLTPVGEISPQNFHHYAEIVKSVTDIRLLDVSPIPECRHFNPQEFSQGRIFYNPSVEPDADDTTFLEDFEPFRKTFIVIGLGIHPASPQHLTHTLASLKADHPAAISHNIIYQQSLTEKSELPEIFHISKEAEKIRTSIETVLCGITRNFLVSLDEYAYSYESITLRSPISLMDSSVLTRTINLAQKRLSSGLSFKPLFANGQNVTSSVKDLKVKSLQRQTGRQAKIMGNFFLLAGRTQDALQYFTDAAINSKKSDDYLWLASALEGIAVSATILLHLGLPFQIQNPMFASVLHLPKSRNSSIMKSNGKVSMEDIVSRKRILVTTPRNSTSSSLSLGTHQLGTIIDVSQVQIIEFLILLTLRTSHYYKLSTYEVDDCVPDIVYVESLLRNTKLMVTIYLSRSRNTVPILEQLVGFESLNGQKVSAEFNLLQKNIVAEMDRIFALQLNKLDITKQCRIYCALASIYRDLGLYRKYGLVIRLLLDVLLPQASFIEQNLTSGELGSAKYLKDIIETLLYIYHIDEKKDTSCLSPKHNSNWIVLQLLLIKVCLRIAEAFQDYATLMKLCVLTLNKFTHCLPVEDQIKLRDKLSWLNLISAKEAVDLQAPHPDPFIIRDAKFIVLLRSTSLVPLASKNTSDLKSNSVFFDPYNKGIKKGTADRIICQNEVHQLKVVLQNPFYYGLDIRAMHVVAQHGFKLETVASLFKVASISQLGQMQIIPAHGGKGSSRKKDTVFDNNGITSGKGFSIPPISTAEVIISFRALEPGSFHITEFEVDFGNKYSQSFSIIDQEKYSGLNKLTYYRVNIPNQSSQTLENMFHNLLVGNFGNRATKKIVSLTAITSQPTLSIVKNQKPNDWVMLLEGEVQSSSLKLKNCSNDLVNYLSISPWDSTVDSISSKLSLSHQNNLNAAEVYELEWLLLERKALCVTNKSEIASEYKVIPPGGEVDIHYDIIGKCGMSELKLILEYGKRLSDTHGDCFLKKLIVPCLISIHRSLEITASNIIPLFSSTWNVLSESNTSIIGCPAQESLTDLNEFILSISASSTEDVSDYCLLVLDVRNFWKDCLVAKIASKLGTRHFQIEKCILPNKSAKLFIPVRRIRGHSFDPFKAIPSMRKKQFVKDYTLSREEERQVRRSFWVREELLKLLSARWNTAPDSSHKEGEIDLRRIRLSAPMTNSLLYDDLLIFHEVFSEDKPDKAFGTENSRLHLERERFYILRTRVINHTTRSISGMLRHIPFPLNAPTKHDLLIDQKILYNGFLQSHVSKNAIGPGETYEREIGFMIMEKGQYEWGCVFDVSGEQPKRIIGREPVYIIAS
ncbi:Trs120-domain-containing protein [Metschnikowia bicuspidata var. bicuspidata NRRL YB-4993]|uniref:Trs120-domain-containing protein n=1 Tax=Metschnikowia bicuspidata var. bicuspidata NRRL YB-4993 TaxID=869754 RepID=A0A1A0H7N4_9ASCO|nr:Trs120-domain-containing protein [Metschnikowia bicuspidata var. bicuspidata NRRL YB-4993]OBA20036.1 Trs120-domain-containing protein [Metschnikowia bicuspidata var. bicuspidata NRRL YB-4993]